MVKKNTVGATVALCAYLSANAVANENNATEWMEGRQGVFAGLYDCSPNPGEAYSAAYFGTRRTFLQHRVGADRLSGGQGNMEGASHTVFRKKLLLKTVDMFDFYIEHLSWYERRLFKGAEGIRGEVLTRLKGQTAHVRTSKEHLRQDMVALMPFYATAGGDSGHSALESRRVFLKLTHESLRPHFAKIVACVATPFDQQFLVEQSGLEFFDVLKAEVFRPSRLGFATVHHAQQKLLFDPRWNGIHYVFYTESDQIFHARSLRRLIGAADSLQSAWLIPHRVMPAPLREDLGRRGEEEATTLHRDAVSEFSRNGMKRLSKFTGEYADRSASCCFDRGKCDKRRDHWQFFLDDSVELFQLIPDQGAAHSVENSFALVAGEGNFLKQQFRTCRLNTTTRTYCRPY